MQECTYLILVIFYSNTGYQQHNKLVIVNLVANHQYKTERTVYFTTNLFPLPTPHERRLRSSVVDVGPEVLSLGYGRSFGFFNCLINSGFRCLVNLLLKELHKVVRSWKETSLPWVPARKQDPNLQCSAGDHGLGLECFASSGLLLGYGRWFRGPTFWKISTSQSIWGNRGIHIRVTTVAVGDEFKKKRTFFVLHSPLPSILYSLLDCDDVHSVNLWGQMKWR